MDYQKSVLMLLSFTFIGLTGCADFTRESQASYANSFDIKTAPGEIRGTHYIASRRCNGYGGGLRSEDFQFKGVFDDYWSRPYFEICARELMPGGAVLRFTNPHREVRSILIETQTEKFTEIVQGFAEGEIEICIPSGAPLDGVTIRVEPSFVPAEYHPNLQDNRELGIHLRSIERASC